MAGFKGADAALTGFRIVWERPLAVAYWAGLQFLLTLGFSLFVAFSAGPAFDKMSTLNFQPNQDPTVMLDLLRQLAPTYTVVLACFLVFYSVLYAAMNRAVLKPGDSRFGYLRLSADELRQLGLLGLIALFGAGLYIAVALVAIVLLMLLSLVLGGGEPGELVALALMIPMVLAAFIFAGVRFSLASPMTFATGKINLMGSWRLTKGRFWPLLGTYALAFVLNMVVLMLTLSIAVALVAMVGGGMGAITTVLQSDMSSPAAVLTPARLVYLAISAAGTALSWPVTLTPPAAIYRALAGDSSASVSRVFD